MSRSSSLLFVLGVLLATAPGCASSARPAGPDQPGVESRPAADDPPSPAADSGTQPAPAADAIRAAIDHPARPQDDRDRDAARKPDQVLSFFGIAPGMKVAEMMAGRGYYVEILARLVGPGGHVYAQNNQFVLERFAEKPLSERLAHPDLGHVTRLDRELDDPGLPAGQLDAVLMILFYHDAYWMKTDRAKMNRAIFDSLAPGGVFGIIDHAAEPGSGDRDVRTIHRVDADLVKQEILAAGFVLDGESDVLRNPDDDHTRNVFDEQIRGKTDRFVYRFRKPE